MTLDEIKDKYAENRGYDYWADFINDQPNWKVEHIMNEISELYADQKSSELKEQRDELLKRMQSLVLSMAAHPDCTEGSEFDDLSTIGQELINKIKDNE